MVLKGLGESLRGVVNKIATAPFIDSRLIKDVVKDIQRALIYADINVPLVLKLTKEIEGRALEEKPPAGMSNREHVLRIVHDELAGILGKGREIPLKKQIIMMVGVYGQGKTTTCGKLARYFQKKGLRPGLIAGDIHRPAAYEQLQQIADKINVPVYGGGKNAVAVVKEGIKELNKQDVIIVDTAGRHKLEDILITEMKEIFKVAKPDEKILVMDASTGQQAGPMAKAFNDAIAITGVILTKMDGTAKGGGALSAVAEIGAPILYIGTGEHAEDFEKFEATRFISRLLGMGDIETLLEKAEETAKGKDIEKTAKQLMSGKFTLKEMYDQMEMLTKMGPLHKIVDLLPGVAGGTLRNADMHETQQKLKKFRIVMDSMTSEEMENPRILKASRIKRIARGAGVEPREVKELVRYYNMSRKMMKGLSSRKAQRRLMEQLDFGG
jgi:signal recognition particle subunit SRP54